MHFVISRKPFFHRLLPDGIPQPKLNFIPCLGFKILQLAIAIPDCGPLHTGLHACVCIKNIHLFDGVPEAVCFGAGPAVIDLSGKFYRIDLDIRLRGDIALE